MFFWQQMTQTKQSLGLCLLAISVTTSAAGGENQMPAALVEVVKVEQRKMAPTMSVSGNVISLNDTRISTEVKGNIVWIADVGTKVNQGDVVARVDPTFYQIDRRRMSAQVKRLKVDLKFREQEVKRFQTLAARDSASEARLQAEKAKKNMLVHDISDANAALELANEQLIRCEIRAPFSGHLAERLSSVGEYLSVGEQVLRLVDTNNLDVALFAPISILPYVQIDDKIMVSAAEGASTLENKTLPVRRIVPIGDSTSRMVEIRLALPADDWVVGTPVTISVPNGNAINSIAIPRDALIIKGSDQFIYRVNSEMQAEQIKADIHAVVGSWVSINNQIKVGDQVVIRGGERLMPGQTVMIKEPNNDK